MLALYEVTCRARDCAALPVMSEDILAIRGRICELDAQWRALPVGEALDLEF